MKRIIALMMCVLLAASCLTGCAAKKDEPAAPAPAAESSAAAAPASTEPAAAERVELKVWHDGNEAIMRIIEENVNAALADENISITFEKRSGMNDNIQLYGNDPVNGPDMFLWAHDSIGTFATMGVLAPLSDICDVDALLADALPMTKTAGNFNGVQYQLPIYFETLLLIYNKDLWEGDLPETSEELYDYMAAHTDPDAGMYAVLNQHTNAYNVSPFIYGYGGFVIDESAVPGFNDPKTMEAVEYNRKFGQLQADGDYNTVTTLFNEGKSHGIIGGPWLIDGIKAAGIDYGVKSLADITLPNGNKMSPFSGVQGICVLKRAAEEHKDAIAKVLNAMFTAEIGIALGKEAGCAPAHQGAYDDPAIQNDEMILAIQKTAETAVPMPNLPEMTAMWGPAEEYLVAVNVNGIDVQTAAESAQASALQIIADMQ